MKELSLEIPTFVLQKKLVVGNDYDKKQWTCYVRGEGNSPLSDLIQKVEFKTKNKSEICDEEPYEMSSNENENEIKIIITFHPKCNKTPITLSHNLVLKDGGISTIQQVAISLEKSGIAKDISSSDSSLSSTLSTSTT